MNLPERQIFKSVIGSPIKINLNVNIENKPTNIILTSSILYYPEILKKGGKIENNNENNQTNQYPLLPPVGVDYPIQKLIKLPFNDMIKILFNPDIFNKKMTKWTYDADDQPRFQSLPKDHSTRLSEEKTLLFSQENMDKINWEKKNVQILLHLLFPTFYFGSLEYKTSMHYWNPNETFHAFPIERIFSYLKYNGKVYTITNCVWMNDILNVPAYKPYIDGFKFFFFME